jgi:SnoaL-like domain
MGSLISAIAGVVIGSRVLAAQAPEPTEAYMRAVAGRIVALDASRQEATGTIATIDSLLAMYSDSAVYEDPAVAAVVRGKQVMRQAMRQYIGSIRHLVASVPRITVGHRVAVVEARTQMEILRGGSWVPVSRHGIRVIEFGADGLVRRVLDYPG